MAKLSSRTLTSNSRPTNDPQRSSAAQEAAAALRPAIDGLFQQLDRVTKDRRSAVDSITDAPLRRSLGGS